MLLGVVGSSSVGKLKPQRFGVPEADPFVWGSSGARPCGAALGQSG